MYSFIQRGTKKIQSCDGGEPTPAPEIIPMNAARSSIFTIHSCARAHSEYPSLFHRSSVFRGPGLLPLSRPAPWMRFPFSVALCIQYSDSSRSGGGSHLNSLKGHPITNCHKMQPRKFSSKPLSLYRSMPRSFWRSRG